MKKRLSLLLVFMFLVCIIQPVYAATPKIKTLLPSSPEDAELIGIITRSNQWDKMTAYVDDQDKFDYARYYVKSTGATYGIRYRTVTMTFEVGGHSGSCGTELFRSKQPAPKETIYDQVMLSREFMLELLGQDAAPALDTEQWLYVGAVLEIYNSSTGVVLDTCRSEADCQTYGEKHKFGVNDIKDMKSRWNKVQLRGIEEGAPDYWITSPNGTSFTGEPGTDITIPAEVWNSGNKKDTTDLIIWWEGKSWEDKEAYYDNLTLGYGEKADTPVTVTIPSTPTKLWFRCNVDNNTPAGEADLTNNTLAVTVGPDGVDLGLFLHALPPYMDIPWSMDSYPGEIAVVAVRDDYVPTPVDAVVTVYTPFGTKTFNVTGINGGETQEFLIDCPVSAAGNYVFNGIIEPSGGYVDIDLSNNQASCTMVITRMPAPVMPKIEVESELKGGITG